ncbi:MAG: ssl1498 family light-harvesting-like protein [Pleurocapsa sp. MO_226.B13]|nr:ssl1498 family light-harvesting-like protein [Pleurocapsa sp. MO_226.B13]
MPYTEEEGGRLNNFAREPQMYTAEEPTSAEKRNYLVFGVLAFLLLSGVIAVAVYASSAS